MDTQPGMAFQLAAALLVWEQLFAVVGFEQMIKANGCVVPLIQKKNTSKENEQNRIEIAKVDTLFIMMSR